MPCMCIPSPSALINSSLTQLQHIEHTITHKLLLPSLSSERCRLCGDGVWWMYVGIALHVRYKYETLYI